MQRISMAVQRGNSPHVVASMPAGEGLENILSLFLYTYINLHVPLAMCKTNKHNIC